MSTPQYNPYQAPVTSTDQPTQPGEAPSYPPERLWRAFILGLLGMIGGGLGLVGTVMGIFSREQQAAQAAAQGLPVMPEWLFYVNLPIGIVMSIWILCAGYGLFNMREWGRQQFIYQTIAALVLNLVGTVLAVAIMADFKGDPQVLNFMYLGIAFAVVIQLIIAGLVFWLLTTERCRERFAANERYLAAYGRR